jgi:hypothetical protein
MAYKKLADLSYEKAKKEQSIEWYEKFLQYYDKSGAIRAINQPDYRDIARKEITGLSYLKAVETGTIEGYREFRKKFPHSPFDRKASQEIWKLQDREAETMFSRAEEKKTIEAYEDFLRESEKKFPTMSHPASSFIGFLKRRARHKAELLYFSDSRGKMVPEADAWKRASSRHHIQGYVSYYCFYPMGKHRRDALDEIKRLAPASLRGTIKQLSCNNSVSEARAADMIASTSSDIDILVPFLIENLPDQTPLGWALKSSFATVQSTTTGAVAANALGVIGDYRVVDLLIKAADSYDEHCVSAVINSLGQLSDGKAIFIVARKLSDSNKMIRWSAEKAIGKFPGTDLLKVSDILLRKIRDRSENMRAAIVTALGKTKDVKFLEPLLASLKDKESKVRIAAARVLGDFNHHRVIEHLISALEEQELLITITIRKSLQKLTGHSFPGLDKQPERSYKTWSKWWQDHKNSVRKRTEK